MEIAISRLEVEFVPLPTVQETLGRIELLMKELTDPEQRAMLAVVRDHWWAEVMGDVDAIMRTVVPGRHITQQFGKNWRGVKSPTSAAEARASYQAIIDSGVMLGMPVEAEYWSFASWGVGLAGLFTAVYPGKLLAPSVDSTLSADRDYVVRWHMSQLFPIEKPSMLIQGELIYRTDPISIEPAGPSDRARLLGQA